MSHGITYKSTRGKQTGMTFEQVVLGGLANDKGLYVPETIPSISMSEIESVLSFLISSLTICLSCYESRYVIRYDVQITC